MGVGSKDVLLVGQNHRTPTWASWMHLGPFHHRVGLRVTLSTNWASTDFGESMWFLTHTFRKFHGKYIKRTSHPTPTHLFLLWNNKILFSAFEILCMRLTHYYDFLGIIVSSYELWKTGKKKKAPSPTVIHCSSILWALNLTSLWPLLANSTVATGLEKVSFHSNPKERQCQKMLKLPHNCTHLTH